jgi:uncharacterized SAM-binding protein YcdF (DUF218 family)
MFFLLSKILSFLLIPFNWCIILITLNYVIKNARWKRLSRLSAILIFVFFSNGFIFQKVISAWEYPAESFDQFANQNKAIVVLGGMSSYDDELDRIYFKEASDRLLQGMLLAQKNPALPMIISGGSAEIYFEERPEADYLKEYLNTIGIDEGRVFFEKQSRNTHENAFYSAALFDSLQIDKNIVLITSGFHMARARACFEKQGFEVSPLSAHLYTNHQPLKPMDYFMPSLTTLQLWPILIKEWLGIAVYKMKGYV